MGFQKNFVVKNGLEVNDNLIFADRNQNTVGIGTTTTPEKLQVNGGIGATSLILSGIGTIPTLNCEVGIVTSLTSSFGFITTASGTTLNYDVGNIVSGIITNLSGSRLNYSGIATVGSLAIGPTRVITPSRQVKNIISLDVSGISTIANLTITRVGSGATVGSVGVVTYYGDASGLYNVAPGAPGGSDTNVQYNNAGSFDGSNNFTFDGSTVVVGSAVTVNSSGIAVSGIVTSNSFVKTGGTSSQFLKADGSVDSNTYLTSYTETQTINDVLVLGNTSSLGMSVGVITATSVRVGSSVTITPNGIYSGILTATSAIVGSAVTITSNGIITVGVVTATDFNSTSDINLKENVTTVDQALSITNKLRGVRFEWKRDHKPSYGVIAQELQDILPELVSDTNPKTVNYNGIIGILIESIKELSNEIEELKKKSI